MALLETRSLGKTYGALTAVDSLDLAVERGEIFGLLGPNGAGKTTTISMICGVITPTSGSVIIDGHDLGQHTDAAKRAIGLVPQDLAVYEPLDARQNLAFFGSLYGLRGRELDQRIDWALDVAGLRDRCRDQVAQYSGGMKRRLNLAAGLLHRPKLLILDEPTVGVDPQSRNHIFQTIRQLVAEQDMTVLYTSHYMEEVELLCRRVAIMDDGSLIAAGQVGELVDRHGGRAIEIEYRGPQPEVEAAVAELGTITPLGASGGDGHRLRLDGAVKPGLLVRAVERVGGEVDSLAARGGNLEQVFLALTGHSLRDEP